MTCIFERKVKARTVCGGVAQDYGAHPVRVTDRVLQGNEPTVRTASDDDLFGAGPLVQTLDIGRTLDVICTSDWYDISKRRSRNVMRSGSVSDRQAGTEIALFKQAGR